MIEPEPTRRARFKTPRILLLALLLLGGAPRCTIHDDVVRDIGVAQLFFVDPGITRQSVPASDPDLQIQVAEWEIQEATLELPGNILDLRFGEACRFIDTTFVSPVPEGACASGIIIDANTEPVSATLTLTFTMSVRRAEPVDQALLDDGTADFDSDGVDNASDNCPVAPNPSPQADADSDGVGDACVANSSLDSDGDDISDTFDNCVWVSNLSQADDGIVFGDPPLPIPDGIGNDCVEQVAEVRLNGNPSIQTSIQITDFLQPRQPAFLAVDFNNSMTLQCDWTAGTCALDDAALQMCVRSSLLTAQLGCS